MQQRRYITKNLLMLLKSNRGHYLKGIRNTIFEKATGDSVSQAQSTADAAAESCKALGGRCYLPDYVSGLSGGHTIGFSWSSNTLSAYVDGTLVRSW